MVLGARIKLQLFEAIYGLNRFDGSDPELFMAHGTADVNPATPFQKPLKCRQFMILWGFTTNWLPWKGKAMAPERYRGR